jgi:hypothetical protein
MKETDPTITDAHTSFFLKILLAADRLPNYEYTSQLIVKCIFIEYYYTWGQVRKGKSVD